MDPGTFYTVSLELLKKNVFGQYSVNSAGEKEWRHFQNPPSVPSTWNLHHHFAGDPARFKFLFHSSSTARLRSTQA